MAPAGVEEARQQLARLRMPGHGAAAWRLPCPESAPSGIPGCGVPRAGGRSTRVPRAGKRKRPSGQQNVRGPVVPTEAKQEPCWGRRHPATAPGHSWHMESHARSPRTRLPTPVLPPSPPPHASPTQSRWPLNIQQGLTLLRSTSLAPSTHPAVGHGPERRAHEPR